MAANFLQLDADQLVETIDTLNRRIAERFPNAGLSKVCQQLLDVAKQAKVRSEEIAQPIWWVRGVTVAVVGAIAGLFLFIRGKIKTPAAAIEAGEFVQIMEAGFNSILLVGASLLFLMTLSTRLKRQRCMRAIHELRSMAHIIDMHQLTKDPERLLSPEAADTASSPKRNMTPFLLNRYLDYCSEMLSLVSKIAALYVQKFEDSEAVSAVNDLEDLTSGLARKVWQKIMILDNGATSEPQPDTVPAPLPAAHSYGTSAEPDATPRAPASGSGPAATLGAAVRSKG
jgi:hypothetical protein